VAELLKSNRRQMNMADTLDVRGLRAAPPYLENEDTETAWLRADLALDVTRARAYFVTLHGIEPEMAQGLAATGPLAMRPDTTDEFCERWVPCDDALAEARYWQLHFT
jgi:hypothetical protein